MLSCYPTKYVDSKGFIKSIDVVDTSLINKVSALDQKVNELDKKINTDEEDAYEMTKRVELLEIETTQLFDLIGSDTDTNPNDIESRLTSMNSVVQANKNRSYANEARLNSLEPKVTTNTTDIATLNKTLSTTNSTITELQSKVTTNTTDIASLDETLSTTNSTATSALNLANTNSSTITDLQTQLTAALAEIENLKTALNNKLDKTHTSTLTVPTFNASTFDLTGFYSSITNTDISTFLSDLYKWISAMMSALQGKY